MEAVQGRLKELGIRYVQRRVVDQIFFHDPDGFMIELEGHDLAEVNCMAAAQDDTLQPVAPLNGTGWYFVAVQFDRIL
ncbi:Glyoxalase [Hordeum vulgare]|nr:Glyoxalase [Hordeum vulgare]